MKVYEVGGAVRDRMFGVTEPDDIDYLVTGPSVEGMDKMFKRVHVGNNEQLVWLDRDGVVEDRAEGEEAAEVALPRVEVSTGSGHNEFEYTTEGVSVEDDLRRRDLTMNAMARNVKTGELIDPFGGRDDIENRVARHVSEKFKEDPIRVLRLARFVARYNLQVADETLEIAREVAPDLMDEPGERIRDELLKVFKQEGDNETPRRFFDVLRDVGALEYSFPLVYHSIGTGTGGGVHHLEGDLYTHTMLVLEYAHHLRPNDVELQLAALAHDLGKVKAYTDDAPDSRHHDEYDDFVVDNFFHGEVGWKKEYELAIRDGITEHMRMHTIVDEDSGTMGDGKVLELVGRHTDDTKHLDIEKLVDLMESDTKGRMPGGDLDRDAVMDRINDARDAIEKITGSWVIEHHGWRDDDGNLTVDGETVGETIRQDRLKEMRGDVSMNNEDSDLIGQVTEVDGRSGDVVAVERGKAKVVKDGNEFLGELPVEEV